MADHLPHTPFSLRDSYLPSWRAASFAELSRTLEPWEGQAARVRATREGLMVIQ
jgi:hypothetical protein